MITPSQRVEAAKTMLELIDMGRIQLDYSYIAPVHVGADFGMDMQVFMRKWRDNDETSCKCCFLGGLYLSCVQKNIVDLDVVTDYNYQVLMRDFFDEVITSKICEALYERWYDRKCFDEIKMHPDLRKFLDENIDIYLQRDCSEWRQQFTRFALNLIIEKEGNL